MDQMVLRDQQIKERSDKDAEVLIHEHISTIKITSNHGLKSCAHSVPKQPVRSWLFAGCWIVPSSCDSTCTPASLARPVSADVFQSLSSTHTDTTWISQHLDNSALRSLSIHSQPSFAPLLRPHILLCKALQNLTSRYHRNALHNASLRSA